jgi:hypothetical protein
VNQVLSMIFSICSYNRKEKDCFTCAIEALRGDSQRKQTLRKQKTSQLRDRPGNESGRHTAVMGAMVGVAASSETFVAHRPLTGTLSGALWGHKIFINVHRALNARREGGKKKCRRVRRGGSGRIRRVARREASARLIRFGLTVPGGQLPAEELATSGGVVSRLHSEGPYDTIPEGSLVALRRDPVIPFLPFLSSGLTRSSLEVPPVPVLAAGQGFQVTTQYKRVHQVGDGTVSDPLRLEPIRGTVRGVFHRGPRRTVGLHAIPDGQWHVDSVDRDEGSASYTLRREPSERARGAPGPSRLPRPPIVRPVIGVRDGSRVVSTTRNPIDGSLPGGTSAGVMARMEAEAARLRTEGGMFGPEPDRGIGRGRSRPGRGRRGSRRPG